MLLKTIRLFWGGQSVVVLLTTQRNVLSGFERAARGARLLNASSRTDIRRTV